MDLKSKMDAMFKEQIDYVTDKVDANAKASRQRSSDLEKKGSRTSRKFSTK